MCYHLFCHVRKREELECKITSYVDSVFFCLLVNSKVRFARYFCISLDSDYLLTDREYLGLTSLFGEKRITEEFS